MTDTEIHDTVQLAYYPKVIMDTLITACFGGVSEQLNNCNRCLYLSGTLPKKP